MIDRIALGTVQFGLKYGISNVDGQVPLDEIERILALCRLNGISTLDTAFAYGNSEDRLGQAGVEGFRVVSKLPADVQGLDDARQKVEASMQRLQDDRLYGLLLHDYGTFDSGRLTWTDMLRLQEEYDIQKIGFSFYHPTQWEEVRAKGIVAQLVQVPYNLFDRRFEPQFARAGGEGTEIHVRSVFLQGLFFRDLATLPDHFSAVAGRLRRLKELAGPDNKRIAATCLRFVLENGHVDRAVIGTDNSLQLQSNLIQLTEEAVALSEQEKRELQTDDLNILNPALWKY